MTRAKYVVLATILTVAFITCLAVPVVAANSASGNSSASASKLFHHYDEGTCINDISSTAVTPTSVLPTIPPQVSFTINTMNNMSLTPFIEVNHGLPASSGSLKKNGDTGLQVTVSPVPTPAPLLNTSAGQPGTPVSSGSGNSSANAPAGAEPGQEKPDKHWLIVNNSSNSVKKLTRADPLYTSWTSHLDTPRAITLNATTSLTGGKSVGTGIPANDSSDSLQPDQLEAARGTARQQIGVMSQRMELFKAYVANSSSLTAQDKALLLSEADNSTLWLSGKEAEIQSATDAEAAHQIMADVDSLMPVMATDLQRNAGLLACNEINGRIGEALNASLTLGDRTGQMGLSDSDLALAREDLADCREHLLNASLYSDSAAEAFQSIDDSGDSELRYQEGLGLLQQSRTELNLAYMAINKLFHQTVGTPT